MRALRHVVYHLMPPDWKETYMAFCGQHWPRNVTSNPAAVTCKRCNRKMDLEDLAANEDPDGIVAQQTTASGLVAS